MNAFKLRQSLLLLLPMLCHSLIIRSITRKYLFQRSIRCFGGSSPYRKQGENDSLSWETFEFSESPKWDTRFDTSRTVIAANEEELEVVRKLEEQKDLATAQRINQHQQAWQTLSPELIERATQLLLPYVTQDRIERIKSVLQKRTVHTRFLFENPANPSNVWACLRTVDSFGIQNVDVVLQSGVYQGKAAIAQKRGMRTAVGSAQWLTLRNHLNSTDAIRALKEQDNCRILATDVNPSSKDIRQINWTSTDQPICIVMGNEERGISEEIRNLADETFYLPMVGFAESYNLSVATAITLAYLSAASQGGKGPLRPGDMSDHQFKCLFLKGLFNSVSQKRMAYALLRKENVELPKEIHLL